MKRLVIFGTGGFAREVHQIVEDLNAERPTWQFEGFLDDAADKHGSQIHDMPVLGGVEWLRNRPDVHVVVGIGSTAAKRRVVERAEALGHRAFATLVHPRAWIGNRVSLGEGSIVCAGTLVTTDITIGRHVILNLACTVGHDTHLADFVTVAPGVNISGKVYVDEGCDLGTGCRIVQNLTLGHWSIVGAGAVVAQNLPANVTAVGVPAKPIKERPEGWHH